MEKKKKKIKNLQCIHMVTNNVCKLLRSKYLFIIILASTEVIHLIFKNNA